jgi:hypothetical protein
MTAQSQRVFARKGRLIRDGWQDYAEKVLPADAPPVQKQETRRAFYAGAWEILMRMADLGEPDISEDQGAEVLEATKREIERFVASVGTSAEGRA